MVNQTKNEWNEWLMNFMNELAGIGLERRANIEFMKWMSGNWLPEMNDCRKA